MISSYYFRGSSQEPWEFDETRLSNINLFVGATGSGKTRFLNTLFNLAGFVSKGEPFRAGQWRITAETNGREYKWEFHCDKNKQGKNEIIHETLGRKLIGSDAAFEVLIQRTPEQFSFRGNTLPKLQVDKPSVTLLKEEEVIRPFHETFEKIQRRKFQDEELRNAMALQPVTKEQIDSIKSGGILALWEQGHALSAKMFLGCCWFQRHRVRCMKKPEVANGATQVYARV